jgi:hypothetical protein
LAGTMACVTLAEVNVMAGRTEAGLEEEMKRETRSMGCQRGGQVCLPLLASNTDLAPSTSASVTVILPSPSPLTKSGHHPCHCEPAPFLRQTRAPVPSNLTVTCLGALQAEKLPDPGDPSTLWALFFRHLQRLGRHTHTERDAHGRRGTM